MFTEMLGIRFYTLVFADKEKRKRNRGEHFEKFTYEALGAAVVLRIDASLLLLFACLLAYLLIISCVVYMCTNKCMKIYQHRNVHELESHLAYGAGRITHL